MHLTDPQEIKNSKVPVFYYLFDILYFDGYNLTKLELRSRKSILKSAISFKDPLRFMTHRIHDGEAFHKEACNKGWEGLIAKDAGSAYVHGRSKKWLKFKCVSQQEFVIGGYTEPKGERIGFGALLIGYYENKSLKYAGKVGTGYNDKLLKTLTKKLENRERKTSPFSSDDIREKNVHWVTPELVGEIGFTEWTSEGKLRHPRFLGLRDDKNPKRVVKEQ
jgi:bifunctional non-homologous end joining protein LigD